MSKNVKSSRELTPNPAYELMYEEYLDDIKSAGIVFRHKKSGARVCVISNDDENKMFCAAFRTPPENSTGVPHIIEHTVLCGSKNYPSRDPFMQLAKGSLNTFLNAMTYPDKTLYPVASCNDKDFKNLMNVYMDAVFYPNIYKYRQIFMQEGWHYEMEDADSDLEINGVVYSEMKGATSSPERAIWDVLGSAIFPDTTYGVNSGGDPAVIPELTYEYYLDFHRRFYHPSNSYIFIYGDCDVEERLAWMDENYLSAFDQITPNSEVARQEHFGTNEPKRITDKYSIGATDETEGKAYFAFAALCGSSLDVLDCRAWGILSDVLIYSPGAPVKQALLDAGIGQDVFGGYDTHMIEDDFSVIVKNAKAEDLDKFYNIVIDTLKKQVEEGISEKALLACINRDEFYFREADYGGSPRGLDYAATMLQSWLYDDNAAFDYMHFLDDCAELKKRIGTGYYEGLIKKYILESDHCVLIQSLPEPGLVEKKNEELKKQLAEYKASLTKEEIDKIVEETRLLREYQEHEPTEEELNCIPSLQRSDIPRETVPFYNEERTVAGAKTVYHDVETNGITYLNILFDIDGLPKEYIPYVGLLGAILGKIDTADHTYADLVMDIKLNTGSLSFGAPIYRMYGKADEYRPMYGVYTRMLADKVDYALETAAEIITSSKFEDTKRLREIIGEVKSGKQRGIMNNGNSVGTARARSYFSKADCYLELLSGIDYYLFLCDLHANFDAKADEISAKLRDVTNWIFNPDRMIVSLAADDAGYKAVEANLPGFMDKCAGLERRCLGEPAVFVPVKKNEGIMIPSQVQYVCRAGNLGMAGLEYHGAMQVVKTAVNYDYLYQNIRVKGGAYGCGCGFASDTGNVQFHSYRDPKLAETEKVYEGTGDYVRNLNPDEKELTKYIIGTFSGYERPISRYGKASRSFDAYITGNTYEEVLRRRAEMLDITAEQFAAVGDVFDKILEQGYLCAVGNEKNIADNKDMFDNLITIN